MANTRSANKNARKAAKRHQQRVQVKSELKTLRKNFLDAVGEKNAKPENVKEALRSAIRRYDKAASNGIITRNTASRKVGRMMRALHKATHPTKS